MSCQTCNSNKCGCISKGLTTPDYCPDDTPVCPTPAPCYETYNAACVIYTGPDNQCLDIETDQTVNEVIETLVDKVADLTCNPESAYNTIQDEGVALPQRTTINFVGTGVTATDNGTKTIVTINQGVTPISTTYTNLVSLINSSSLQPGANYLISDFQTIYDQPDYEELSPGVITPKAVVATKTGPTERLIVTAVDNNTLSAHALSADFPKDQIRYDYSFQTTEVMNAPAKGRIIERIDEWNNRTDYDHRVVLFKRYKEDPSFVFYMSYYDTGLASSEILTFDLSLNATNDIITNNYIGNNFNNDYSKTLPFLLANNVFICEDYIINNNFGNNCTNNTLYAGIISSNNISDYFYNNLLGADDINNNIITSLFHDNIIKAYFLFGNKISTDFIKNKFGLTNRVDFSSNIIESSNLGGNTQISFYDNTIDSYAFTDNTIRGHFTSNVFLGSSSQFKFNNIDSYFSQNQLNPCYIAFNNIGAKFENNIINTTTYENNKIGHSCANNTFNGDFTNNTIGNYCGVYNYNNPYPNTFGSADSNKIGNYIWNNVIGDNFNNNVIGDYFGNLKTAPGAISNTIGDNFQINNIGNYFGCTNDLIQGGNNILGYFYNNKIGNHFYGNLNIDYNFYQNNIGDYFHNNITIGNYFHDNRINGDFSTNTIGSVFTYNDIFTVFVGNTILDGFNDNNIICGLNYTNFSTVTSHVYQNYNCTISTASNGTNYLQYINGTPAIVITSPTS